MPDMTWPALVVQQLAAGWSAAVVATCGTFGSLLHVTGPSTSVAALSDPDMAFWSLRLGACMTVTAAPR